MDKHVLIVEDEPHLIESLTFILEREGYQVTTALDGEAALQCLWQAAPDLLILDVMLPGLNGFDVLKKIRGHAGLRTLPVIVLTAKGQRQDRDTALAVGADVFLTKPFANKDIIAAVAKLTVVR
ncbi:MAG: response regulator transcription factor [Geminicoccaceae bacterium]